MLVGNNVKIDLFDGLCRVYKKAKWTVKQQHITGNIATLQVNINGQDLTFRLKLDNNAWRIYSMTSPAYRIDEQGLHETF